MVWPNFTLRGDRRCCRRACCTAWAASCATRRRWAATTWWNCSGAAAWARCGAPSTSCWRAQAAIKLVRPEVLGARSEAEVQTLLRRFEREAQATAALSSPHTHPALRLRRRPTTASFYYVMELLAGRDLESLVREFGPVPADRAVYPAAAGVPLAGRRARARARAPRHQAGQHLRLPHGPRLRLRQGAGLRPRQGQGSRAGHADAGDHRAHDQRYAGLHGAGNHPGRHRRGPPRRRLRAGVRGLLPADRAAGVRGRHAR